jgi:tetratricopeptide (TPR) repeat protein
MKKTLYFSISFLIAVIGAGCSGQPASPIAASTPAQNILANATTSVEQRGVFCPTDNEQAKQAYNDAIALQEKGDLEEASKSFKKAIELDPKFCDAMDNLGQILRSQGNIDEAISWYKKSIEVSPNNTVAHQNLAFAYQTQGNLDGAIAEYQLLTQIDPNEPEGYYGLGNIYLGLNKPQDAIPQLEKAAALYEKNSSPFLADAKFSLGVAHFMLGEYEKSRDYFEAIYPDMQNNPYLNYYLGLCYLKSDFKDMDIAKKYLTKAQELGVKIPAEVLQEIGQ